MNADMTDPLLIPYVICALDDIPSRRAKAFQLVRRVEDGGERAFSIFVVRWGTQVFGYVNECPHNQVNLDWERNQFLDPNGLRIMCGKHGALFEIGTVLVLRAHYTMDVFAGAVTALYVHTVAWKLAPTVDRWLADIVVAFGS